MEGRSILIHAPDAETASPSLFPTSAGSALPPCRSLPWKWYEFEFGISPSSYRERKRKERKERKRKKKIIGSLITPILTLAGAPRIFAITRGIFVAVLAKWYVQKKKNEKRKEKRNKTNGCAFSRNVSPVITMTGRRVRHERGNADRSG